MRRSWIIRPIDEKQIHGFSRELSISSLTAQILIHRGIGSSDQADDFLCSDLGRLGDPASMKDLSKAVALIRKSIQARQKILLIGDYDVDGLTATALLYRVLKELKAQVFCRIPQRLSDGYGLKREMVQEAHRAGVKLLITLDCGTTSFEELSLARRLKMEAIVVDHHELLSGKVPPASAFLNPLQADCRYPTKDLASVGVAFTLARGLLTLPSPLRGEGKGEGVWEHLDLVALGTVADWAPLVGENRILVKRGLHRLEGTHKVGLKALLAQAKLDGTSLSTEEISFFLAPRLNAMGRMGSARTSLDLLTTEDEREALDLAKTIERQNKLRSGFEREALKRALAKVHREVNFAKDRVIVLEDENWHPGVVGIIASRLTARFHRPSVVIAWEGTLGRGSARSIPPPAFVPPIGGTGSVGTDPPSVDKAGGGTIWGFNLVEALEEVKEHLVEFGGHPAAAGITIARDRATIFRETINEVARRRIPSTSLTPSLEVDAELPLAELSEELVEELEALAPFGAGNPWPVMTCEDARFPQEVKLGRFHPQGMRLTVETAQGRSFGAWQPRQEGLTTWSLRRLGGRSFKMAYSPMRVLGEDGPELILKIRDLKL